MISIEDNDLGDKEEAENQVIHHGNDFEFSNDDISLLCLIHRELHHRHCIKRVDDSCRLRAFKFGYKAARELVSLSHFYETNSTELNNIGALLMGLAVDTDVSLICNRSKSISNFIIGSDEAPIMDFHHDPNPNEIKKAEPVLKHLLNRVGQLLTAFPGHPSLLTVGQVAARLNQCDLTTLSVGKALAGLEIILRKSQEWEQHASERVALGDSLRDVSKLVTQWRKLELNSWPALLDVRERNHINRARQHWPRLYKLLHNEYDNFCVATKDVTLNQNAHMLVRHSPHWVWKGLEEVFGKELEVVSRKKIMLCSELTKVLDGFLLSCSTGEFSERLQLIHSFGSELMSQCKHEHIIHPEQLMLVRTLVSLSEHYAQFLSIITTHRDDLREPIEKRLKDEVKLAKWDEQTYYSLTESSEKSHMKLMRFLKEYDEVLEWRVNQILEKNFLYGVRSSSESKGECATSIPQKNELFPQYSMKGLNAKSFLKNPLNFFDISKKSWTKTDFPKGCKDKRLLGMEKYFNKLTRLLNTQSFSFDSYAKYGAKESGFLCDTIFDRIEALRENKVTTPMKQRALVDLFKTLKKQGYSSTKWSISPEIQEARFLLQLPVPLVYENDTNMKDGEIYFKRNIVELSRLRSEISVFGSQFMSQRETSLMLGFSDHGLLMLCQQRCLLSTLINSITEVDELLLTFDDLQHDAIPVHQNLLEQCVEQFEIQHTETLENLKQLLLLIKTSLHLIAEETRLCHARDIIVMLQSIIDRVTLSYSLQYISGQQYSIISSIRVNLIEDTITAVDDGIKLLSKCSQICQSYQIYPSEIFTKCLNQLNLLHIKAKECVDTNKKYFRKGAKESTSKVMKTISSLVEGSLLATQGMYKITSEIEKKNDSDGEIDDIDISFTVWESHIKNSKEWTLINIDKTKDLLKLLIDNTKELSEMHDISDDVEYCMKASHNAVLIVGYVMNACKDRLNDFKLMYRNCSKLLYVILRIFRVLVAKGYCVDNSEEEDGDGEGDVSGMNFEDNVEGTGMGEGEGNNDVTDQIENEEQLLGLKGEDENNEEKKEEQKQLNEEEAETGMEMEGDFDGDMYDVPEKNDAEEKNEAEDEEELDREMGDESSPNDEVVDEKMWDDEDENEDENNTQEEKFEEDSKMKGNDMTEEYRTKEDDEGNDDAEENANDASNQEKSDRENKLEPEGKDAEDEENFPINEDLEDNYEDKHTGIDVREDEDGEQQEGADENEEMDLENELNLDDDDDEKGTDEPNYDDNDAQSIENDDEDNPDSNEKGMEANSNEEEDTEMDTSEAVAASAQTGGEGDEEESEKEDNQEEKDEDQKQVNIDNSNEEKVENAHGVSAANGNDSMDHTAQQEELPDEDEGNGIDEKETDGAEGENEENKGQGTENNDGDGQWKNEENSSNELGSKNKVMDVPNPFRDPGEMEKFWHKKLNMIEDNDNEDQNTDEMEQNDEKNEDNNQENSNSTFEFSKQGQSSTTQVLGSALDDTDISKLDEKEENENENDDMEIDNNETIEDSSSDFRKKEEESKHKPKDHKDNQLQQEKSSMNSNSKVEDIEESNSVNSDEHSMEQDENESNVSSKKEESVDGDNLNEVNNKVITDMEQLRVREDEKLDKQMPSYAVSMDTNMVEYEERNIITNEDVMKARERWAHLQAETGHMSRRLCEKLRLVMEPLVATKLRGDYRSGKRINMKRVIGFIASGYRKDKIWLKRTKPSKRDYRVLLAVDDSESMLKSGAGNMALTTLVTIANGMSQLEIGELGIASFGEEMRLIHPFGQPFTSENGANLITSFKFNEARTRTALCIESAMAALEMANGNSSSSSLQLVFIISDGRIERDSRTKMRRLVRETTERNILLVMIIVEGNNSQDDGKTGKKKKKDSIVTMKEVSFENGKPKIKYFIEDYPFPYYIVLEDMNTLPEVMGDALRQWFEMVSQMQNQGS